MKHYKLTAEQMQQVREAVDRLAFEYRDFRALNDALPRTVGLDKATDALALLDAAMQAPEATDPLDRPMGGHLLDSVRYPTPPEATAGGDVREAAECGICGRPESYGDHDASQLPATLAHPFVPTPMLEAYRMGFILGQRRTGAYETAAVADYKNMLETWTVSVAKDLAALAGAPKPCEHGCVDGIITAYTLNRGTQNIDCPDHGTKPEAPKELCKVCGHRIGIEGARFLERLCSFGGNHPADATPKDEETGR